MTNRHGNCGRHALDNEGLALHVADSLAESVGAMVGRPVKTSFAKVVMMDSSAYLPPHRDESSCEVSVTVVLAAADLTGDTASTLLSKQSAGQAEA